MYDYLIKNGLVVDGSGKPAVKADVAVKGDKVARIAPDIQEPAAEVYDAAGKYVIPGLIDPHVHEEWYCFDDGRYESYIRQVVNSSNKSFSVYFFLYSSSVPKSSGMAKVGIIGAWSIL